MAGRIRPYLTVLMVVLVLAVWGLAAAAGDDRVWAAIVKVMARFLHLPELEII